jgi:hypothetical protein
MVFLPNVGVEVSVGDFLLGRFDESQGLVIVCQLVEVMSPTELLVSRWLEDSLLRNFCRNDSRSPLRPQYENLLKCKLKEVTKYGEAEVLGVSQIHGLAFVFHAHDLEHQWINCAGMQYVFFTRYELLKGGDFIGIDHTLHIPFSNIHPESFTSRLWYSILFLKDKMDSIMNKKTQQQVCRASVNVFMPLEIWHYFCKQFEGIIAPIFYTKNQTKPCMYCDLTLATRSSQGFFSMLRISNQPSMDRARQIFGTTFGIGSRNSPPLKGQEPRTLQHGDIVNLVNMNCMENLQLSQAAKFKEFTAAQGVELVFEAAKRVLSIRVKYSRVMADDAMVGHLLKLTPQPSSNVASNIRRRIIKVGTNFLLNGSLVVVISSDLDNVVVRHADSGIEETINSSNARVLIRQCIGF